MTPVTPVTHLPTSRRLRPAAAVAATLLTLTACSGYAADAPTDADVEEFCTVTDDQSQTAAEVADKYVEVGTPSDISDTARAGFEAYVEALHDEGDRLNIDVDEVTISENDLAEGEAFNEYSGTTCDAYFAENPQTPEPSEPTE